MSVGELYHTMLSLMRAEVRIDHFVSSVGSFWGALSLLPAIQPSKITFWDASEAQLRYGQFIVELIQASESRQDFATALVARNVSEFEQLFGSLTPSSQEHLFELPPSFAIRERTFQQLSPVSQEVYEELCLHQSHPWEAIDANTLVGRLLLVQDVRLLPDETASGLGPREACTSQLIGQACTSSFAYGQGWLRNDDTYALTKAALRQALVTWRVMTFRPLALYQEVGMEKVGSLLGNESRKDNVLVNFMDNNDGAKDLESDTLQSLKAASARLIFAQLNVQNRSDLLYEVEPRWTMDMRGKLSTVSLSNWDSADLLPPEIFHASPNTIAYKGLCRGMGFPCLGSIPRDGSSWTPPQGDEGVSANLMYAKLLARATERLPRERAATTPIPGEADMHTLFAWSERDGVFFLGEQLGLGANNVSKECDCLSGRQRRLVGYFQRARCSTVLQVGGSASIAQFIKESDVDVTYIHVDPSVIPSAKEWKVGDHVVTDVRIPLTLSQYSGLHEFWAKIGIPYAGPDACVAVLGLDGGFFDTERKASAFQRHTRRAPLVVLESCVKTEGWRPNDCGDGDALRYAGNVLFESEQTKYFEEALDCETDACVRGSGSGCGIRALTYHTPSYSNPVPSWPKRRWFFEGRAVLWPFWVPSFTAARPATALRPPLPIWHDIDVPPPEHKAVYFVGQPDYIATIALLVLIVTASGYLGTTRPKNIGRWIGPSRLRQRTQEVLENLRPDASKPIAIEQDA
jgi:hypothetical protein